MNKATINVVDDAMMRKLAKAPWVLVVRRLEYEDRLGTRFADYLLRYGFRGRYDHIETHLEGSGGLWRR